MFKIFELSLGALDGALVRFSVYSQTYNLTNMTVVRKEIPKKNERFHPKKSFLSYEILFNNLHNPFLI
jgi:hypothetical protein